MVQSLNAFLDSNNIHHSLAAHAGSSTPGKVAAPGSVIPLPSLSRQASIQPSEFERTSLRLNIKSGDREVFFLVIID